MQIYENKSQFGWEDDNGIGEQLIQEILSGVKTATAGPKDLYSNEELEELYRSVGHPSTVVDKEQRPRCNIQLLEVFETKFGFPDPRLVYGEGYGADAEAFKDAHRKAWDDLVTSGRLILDKDTVLIVEIFKLLT